MYLKIILVSLFIIFFIVTPIQAVNGYVEVNYDTMKGTGQGIIELNRAIHDNTKIGIKGVSDLYGFGKRIGLPTGIPLNQSYEGFLQIQYKSFRIRLTTWCKHWFSQSGKLPSEDESGVRISTRYSF
ncbi:MAG: hypothetical protein ACOC1K_01755 [Nanoarchaeota archaeon]